MVVDLVERAGVGGVHLSSWKARDFRSRPIGVLIMEDESGIDEKLLCVPVDDLHPYYRETTSYRDMPAIMIEQFAHFFGHYKDMEPGKWVEVKRWGEAEEAFDLLRQGMDRYKKEQGK